MYFKKLVGAMCLLFLGFAGGYGLKIGASDHTSSAKPNTTIPAHHTNANSTAVNTSPDFTETTTESTTEKNTKTTAETNLCQLRAKDEDLINSPHQLDALYCLWRDNKAANLKQHNQKIQQLANHSNNLRARRLAQLILETQANISPASTINPPEIDPAETYLEDTAQNSDNPKIIDVPLSATVEEKYQLIDQLQTSGDDSAIESLREMMADNQEAIRTAAADGLLQLLDHSRGNHELISSALNDSAPFLNDQQAAHFNHIISGAKSAEL